MANWLQKFKKSSTEEEPEDFVLLRQDAQQPIPDTAFDTTDRFSTKEIQDKLNTASHTSMQEDSNAQAAAPSASAKKSKKWLLYSGIGIGTVATIVGLFFLLAYLSNPLRGYTQVEVVKGNIIDAMSTEGTLEANARYEITSLVAGKITESSPKLGDTVTAGTILYQLDDAEAKLAVERAQNLLARSKVADTSATTPDRIYATDTGTVHSLLVRSGSSVSYGQVVATIKKADDSIVAVTSPVAGTVSGMHTSVGKSVSMNSMIATVTSSQSSSSQRTNIYDQKTSELDLKAAQAYLENFTIKAPINGVIVEKNANVGDNVAITNLENPMMVILDTNLMKFTFRVDEYTVRDLATDMNVIVNAESIPNKSFAGKLTRISAEGVIGEDGKPLYEVDVTIEEPGSLRCGMKVTAKVIRASANNVMYVPHRALMEADGKNAVVLVKESITNTPKTNANSAVLDEELTFPWIKVPKGCKLVTVQYGITDGTHVEIISGLKTGDIVVFRPEWEPIDLSPEKDDEEESKSPAPTASTEKPRETAPAFSL